jgi:hypothetical protein
MIAFSDCLADCNLTDLVYAGYDFTWNNRRDGSDNIQFRLDRGTATASFLELYPMTVVEHIAMEESDHMALRIKIADEEPMRRLSGCRGFQFTEMWLKHEGYEDMVLQSWENRDKAERGVKGLWRQLREVTTDMKKWSFKTFGSLRAEIKRLRCQLEAAQTAARSEGITQEVRDIETQLHLVYEKEEIMYRQ